MLDLRNGAPAARAWWRRWVGPVIAGRLAFAGVVGALGAYAHAGKWTMTRGELRQAQRGHATPAGRGLWRAQIVEITSQGARPRNLPATRATPGKRGKLVVKAPFSAMGSEVHQEVGAYALSAVGGFDLVPPTVALDADHSGQLFVDGRFGAATITPAMYQRMHLFDYLIQNGDRGGHNYLVSPDGKRLIAIDHSGGDTFKEMGARHAPDAWSSFVMREHPQPRALFPENAALIRRLDERRIAQALFAAGLNLLETRGVLVRIANLKEIAVGGLTRDEPRLGPSFIAGARPQIERLLEEVYRGHPQRRRERERLPPASLKERRARWAATPSP